MKYIIYIEHITTAEVEAANEQAALELIERQLKQQNPTALYRLSVVEEAQIATEIEEAIETTENQVES